MTDWVRQCNIAYTCGLLGFTPGTAGVEQSGGFSMSRWLGRAASVVLLFLLSFPLARSAVAQGLEPSCVTPPVCPPPRYEWSDAPSPYPDAYHRSPYYEWLGGWRTTETGPREPDLDTYDDGVTWDPTEVVPGETFDLTVVARANFTSCSGFREDLAVWVDWDQNETFDGDELVAYESWTHVGGPTWYTFTWTITVPDDAVPGTTWLRARIAPKSWSPLAPIGGECYGEVEDHRITVTPELSTWSLLVVGALSVGFRRRLRRR